MTVSGIGASSAWHISSEFTSSAAQLAGMLIEDEAETAASNEQSLEATKRQLARAAEQEYQANLEAADAIARGAWVSGGLTVAGGVVSATATPAGSDAMKSSGDALGRLAEPARDYFGERERKQHEAEAQRIGRQLQQAQVEADQLAERARRSDQRADSALDRAQAFVEGENARANAVLSRF
jgi:hypothetical protein